MVPSTLYVEEGKVKINEKTILYISLGRNTDTGKTILQSSIGHRIKSVPL